MKKLTNKEKEIMDLYWQHGPMFVKELLEFYDEPRPHFNTLSTTVRILEKKGFLERMQEAATGQNKTEQREQDAEGMKKYGSARLKSYTSATAHVKDREEEKNVQYKPGSIASKANALRDYYSKNEKE